MRFNFFIDANACSASEARLSDGDIESDATPTMVWVLEHKAAAQPNCQNIQWSDDKHPLWWGQRNKICTLWIDEQKACGHNKRSMCMLQFWMFLKDNPSR